jgi:hypothetical protein
MSRHGDFDTEQDPTTVADDDDDYGIAISYRGSPVFFVDSDIAADMILAVYDLLPRSEQERVLEYLERFMD